MFWHVLQTSPKRGKPATTILIVEIKRDSSYFLAGIELVIYVSVSFVFADFCI
jgi:hypothetical protein